MTSHQTTLVMLPGLDGTGLVFDPLLKHLSAGIEAQVVRYPADRVMSFQEHVNFARKQLPRKKPFVLLAESFSGPIGLQILSDPPDNLKGVLLVATFARHQTPFFLDAGLYLPQKLILNLFTKSFLGRFFCLGSAPSEAVDIFQNALKSVALSVLSNRLKILAELPPPPAISFSGPCLYLQAKNDRMVPKRATAPLQQALPQLQIKQLPGPHITLLAHPETGAQIISSFISELSYVS